MNVEYFYESVFLTGFSMSRYKIVYLKIDGLRGEK